MSLENPLPSLDTLVRELKRLPGIGKRSAQTLAFHLVGLPKERILRLADALQEVAEKVTYCNNCGYFTETQPCPICANPQRERSVICIVEHPQDAWSIERSGAYKGLYHVLGGVLSPLDGIGPSELRIRELLERLRDSSVKEIILATNPSVQGEATVNYLQQIVEQLQTDIRVTRFARGLPIGSELLFTDENTLALAIQQRRQIDSVSTKE